VSELKSTDPKLTLRDRFAMVALTGMLASAPMCDRSRRWCEVNGWVDSAGNYPYPSTPALSRGSHPVKTRMLRCNRDIGY
jgi:hypothetical protein